MIVYYNILYYDMIRYQSDAGGEALLVEGADAASLSQESVLSCYTIKYTITYLSLSLYIYISTYYIYIYIYSFFLSFLFLSLSRRDS